MKTNSGGTVSNPTLGQIKPKPKPDDKPAKDREKEKPNN